MNNKTKIAAGISGTGIVILIFHFWHVVHSIGTLSDSDKSDVFKNAPVYIIQTDSTGKKDTMDMKDYLKNKKPLSPGQ